MKYGYVYVAILVVIIAIGILLHVNSTISKRDLQNNIQSNPIFNNLHETEKEIVIIPNNIYILSQDTKIMLKDARTHSITILQPIPYLTLGEDFLDLTTSTTITNDGYIYEIKNHGCDYSSKIVSDYAILTIDSCKFLIKRYNFTNSSSALTFQNFTKRIDFKTRDGGLFEIFNKNGQFLDVRFFGFIVGNALDKPYSNSENQTFHTVLMSSFDIITNYGVKNVELGSGDYVPLGYEDSVVIGPEKITFKIIDVGNINTRCDPSCRNVFDILFNSTLIDNPHKYTIKILRYGN